MLWTSLQGCCPRAVLPQALQSVGVNLWTPRGTNPRADGHNSLAWLSFYELLQKNSSLAWLELPKSSAREKPNFHKIVEITIIDKPKKTSFSHGLPFIASD